MSKTATQIKLRAVGSFEVSSGALTFSDPCYENNIWCSIQVENVENGRWNARIEHGVVGDWGDRVHRLVTKHSDADEPMEHEWQEVDGEAGVDSGQCGIYDRDRYAKDGSGQGDINDHDSFYGKACQLTLSDRQAGIIDDWGVVSESGFGDGGYPVSVVVRNDKVVAARIIFIEDDGEEEL